MTKRHTVVKLSAEQRKRLDGATLSKRIPRKLMVECLVQFHLRVEETGPGTFAVIAEYEPGELYLTQSEIDRIQADAQGLILSLK